MKKKNENITPTINHSNEIFGITITPDVVVTIQHTDIFSDLAGEGTINMGMVNTTQEVLEDQMKRYDTVWKALS
jgi:hypothetical protein